MLRALGVCTCACVLCAPLYCKWDLKNWHSHLSGAARLSQTNEGPASQSEIDVSFSTSRGEYSKYEEGSLRPRGPGGRRFSPPSWRQ